MAIRIDSLNDCTYLVYFYFPENAKDTKTVRRKNETFNNFKLNNHIKLRYFNVKMIGRRVTGVVKWIMCKIILVISQRRKACYFL